MKIKNIKVSVIVCTYNRKEVLKACLHSLLRQSYPQKNLEIIVVDDGSSDGTERMINRFFYSKLLYFKQSNKGPAAARNLGIKKSKGEIIAFIDSDCVADKDWLKFLTFGFKVNDQIAFGGRIRPFLPKTISEKYAELNFDHQALIDGISGEVPHLGTGNAAFPAKALKETGYFDEDFRCGEDVDLSWRLYFSGFRFRYQPKAVIFHRMHQGLLRQAKQSFVYGRAKTALVAKHWVKLQEFGYAYRLTNLAMDDWKKFLELPQRAVKRYRKLPKAYFKNENLFIIRLELLLFDFVNHLSYRLGMIFQANLRHKDTLK